MSFARFRVTLVIIVASLMGSVMVAPAANAAVTFTQLTLSATVSGTSVTATAKVKAGTRTTVDNYGIALKKAGVNQPDLVAKTNVAITTAGTTMSTAAPVTLTPGTYTYLVYVNKAGTSCGCAWLQVGSSKTFTVTAPSTAMPVGNLTGWNQVVAQDFTTNVTLGNFDTSAYSSSLLPYSWTHDTSGLGTYSAAKTLSVSGGVLDAWLHTESGTPYVTGLVVANPSTGWGQQYGRYSMRMKADAANGYKIAPLLWADSEVWSDGEVDFPETNVLSSTENARANIYLPQSGQPDWQNYELNTNPTSGWHIYTMEWKPGQIKFYVDNVLKATSTRVPSVSMSWRLQFETWIAMGAVPSATSTHIQVDWLTMYTLAA